MFTKEQIIFILVILFLFFTGFICGDRNRENQYINMIEECEDFHKIECVIEANPRE